MATKGAGGGIIAVVIAIAIGLVSVFAVQNVGLQIADRFSTSAALKINATENPEGSAAQTAINTGFYDNMTFMDLAIFAVVAGVVLVALRYFGVY